MGFETSHTEAEARLLELALTPGARVLEAGCGRTTRLRFYRDRIAELVGVDLDAVAGDENDVLDAFVAVDLCGPLPFADGSFDLVYANFVVEHLAAPEAAFAEWRRVLAPDGSLVVLTSNRANPMLAAAHLLPQRARVVVKRLGPGAAEEDVFPAVYRANTPKRLTTSLQAAGFVPVAVSHVATLHRYAGRRRVAGAMLRAAERVLPPGRRSTIVGWYRATEATARAGRPRAAR